MQPILWGGHSAMSNVEYSEKRMHITFESKECSVLQNSWDQFMSGIKLQGCILLQNSWIL